MLTKQQEAEREFHEWFNAWYEATCLDFKANPFGANQYVLQYQAAEATAKALAPEVIELKRTIRNLELASK